jgi:hypothetical protein
MPDIAQIAFVRTYDDGPIVPALRVAMQNVRGDVRPEFP